MAVETNRLTNAVVFLDGVGLLGKAMEIDLPSVTTKFAELKALGLVGQIDAPSGIDKMEAKVKWNSAYPSVMKNMTNPFKTVSLQVRAPLEQYSAQGRIGIQPYVVYLQGQPKKVDFGKMKPNDNAEFETDINVTYIKLEINGEEIYEYDAFNNKLIINGTDVLAEYRAAQGI